MADDKYSLIGFDAIGDAAKLLIEKLSNALGWIASRKSLKHIALDSYIEEIKKSEFDPLTKAALIYKSRKTLSEYCNQNSIIQHAIENMRETAEPEKLDNDWINQFMDKARLVSDDEFQLIWGRILAEECDSPGIVPRTLLHILERMDKEDAEHFTKLCSFSVYVIEKGMLSYVPIILNEYLSDYYSKHGINYDILSDLQALGLIEIRLGITEYHQNYAATPIEVNYFDEKYAFSENVKELPVGGVIFTKSGQALCRVIESAKQEGFFEQYCVPYWEKRILF